MNVTYVYVHIDALLSIGRNLKSLTSLAYVIIYRRTAFLLHSERIL